MSIAELGALGEFVSVFLILVTLIYLAVQNRLQKKLMLSQAFHARLDPFGKVAGWVIEHPQFAEVLSPDYS